MSTETLAPRTEVSAPALVFLSQSSSLPESELTRPRNETSSVHPAPARSLQERRLRAAHELTTRINGLEQDIRQLGDTLAKSRLGTAGIVRDLQQRSSSLTTEILQVGARLAQQGRAQEEHRRLLEYRLGDRMRDLESAAAALSSELGAQTAGQHELRARHDTLARLHEHLDRIVNRQGRNLDILSAEFQQRVELLRVTIESLQDVLHAQQESLLALKLEHDQVSLMVRELQLRLDDFDTRLDSHADQTRQRFRSHTRLLAALAILSASLIGYCQLNPIAVPAAVTTQFSTLASAAAQQREQAAMHSQQLRQQEESVALLAAALKTEQQEIRRLRQAARTANARLAAVQRELATLRMSPAVAAAAPEATAADVAPLPAGSDTIPLPTAVQGSRPVF